jgi:drug/metabolite transporter (DMT)-like permease
MKGSKITYIILFGAIISVSTAAIFIRFAQKSIPSITIAAYRLIIAFLLLFPFTIKKAISEYRQLNKKSFALISMSGFFLAVHFGSWILSLEYTNVISSVVLVTTTPIWVSLIYPYLYNVKIPKRFIWGLLLAFLGIILISVSNSGSFTKFDLREFLIGNTSIIRGNLLALLGAVCAAGYVLLGRTLRKQISTGSYVLLVYFTAGAVLFTYIFLTHEISFQLNKYEFSLLFLLALIPQVIGHSLLNWALGVMPAYFVAITLLGEPIGSTILAFIFLKEIPNKNEIISAGIILLGILIAILGSSSETETDDDSLTD